MTWTGTKPTRNTDLLKTMGNDAPDKRAFQERWYEEDPSQRQDHISLVMKECSPFRTRGWGGCGGWANFQITVDGRTYTVVTMADDPVEWKRYGAHGFRAFAHDRMDKVEYHHIIGQMDKDRAVWLAERAAQAEAA